MWWVLERGGTSDGCGTVKRCRGWSLGLFELAVVAACGSRSSHPVPLGELGACAGVRIGVFVDPRFLAVETDSTYGAVLSREFEMVTGTWYFDAVQPEPGRFAFAGADAVVAFAEEHGMSIRGHTLVWGRALPGWVKTVAVRDSLWNVLRRHIATVVGRYEGRVDVWNVVNEAVVEKRADGGLSYRDTMFWYDGLGRTVIDSAFIWARLADPNAQLFYNDYGMEDSDSKADAVYLLVQQMTERGVPIDGVGIQLHRTVNSGLNRDRLARFMRRLRGIGLWSHVTEADVLVGDSVATERNLGRQAAIYRDGLRACLEEPNCTDFTVWGLTDRYNSRQIVRHRDAPTLFDAAYRAKPAYLAVAEELRFRLQGRVLDGRCRALGL